MSRENGNNGQNGNTTDEEAFLVDERTMTVDGLPLHIWCRTPGNLAKVRALVERGADVNAVDEHDATPVYYCALTGNAPVLRFLLEAGAVLDPKTFVGERVLYAALTPEIKRLLLQYREQTLPSYTDALTEHLRAVLEGNENVGGHVDDDADVGFRLEGNRCIWAHRVVLAARSPIFEKILEKRTSPGKVLRLKHVSADAFEAFLRYLYTSTVSVRVRHAEEFMTIAQRFHLDELAQEVDRQRQWLLRKREHKYEVVTHQRLEDLHINLFGASRVHRLEQDLEHLLSRTDNMPFVDVYVQVTCPGPTYEECSLLVYPAHWLFLRRAEYFRALRDFYRDRSSACAIVRIPSNISPFAFECVLHHMYHSKLPRNWREKALDCAHLRREPCNHHAVDVDMNEFLVEIIAAADLLGYPHVKQSAASAMEINRINVFGLIYAAACYQSRALRAACVRILAEMLLDAVQPLLVPSVTSISCSATRVPEPGSIAEALVPHVDSQSRLPPADSRTRDSSIATSQESNHASKCSSIAAVSATDTCTMPSWQVLNQCPTHVVQVDRHATVFQRARDFIALRQVLSAVEFSEIMEDVREEALRLGLVHKFSSAVRDALGETLDCIVFEITDGLVLAEGSAERTTRHHA